MYIKYEGNLHNLKKYYSIIKGAMDRENFINLIKNQGMYSLEFKDIKVRDYIISEIWSEMTKGAKCYDIDKSLEFFYTTNKYNL